MYLVYLDDIPLHYGNCVEYAVKVPDVQKICKTFYSLETDGVKVVREQTAEFNV